MNIRLPLFWGTWSRAQVGTLPHVLAWRMDSEYSCFIGSFLKELGHGFPLNYAVADWGILQPSPHSWHMLYCCFGAGFAAKICFYNLGPIFGGFFSQFRFTCPWFVLPCPVFSCFVTVQESFPWQCCPVLVFDALFSQCRCQQFITSPLQPQKQKQMQEENDAIFRIALDSGHPPSL